MKLFILSVDVKPCGSYSGSLVCKKKWLHMDFYGTIIIKATLKLEKYEMMVSNHIQIVE